MSAQPYRGCKPLPQPRPATCSYTAVPGARRNEGYCHDVPRPQPTCRRRYQPRHRNRRSGLVGRSRPRRRHLSVPRLSAGTGDQSVLFDPGSHLTFAGTLRKIEEVIPFTKIGYFVCLPFWLVEQHDWRLQLLDRELRFVFTPYAHFPGAICSFDPSTRALRRPHRGRTRDRPIATKQDPRRVGSGAPERPGHA